MAASLSQLLRSNTAGVWRFVTYNCQRSGSGSRLYDLTAELRCDVLGLQSTGLRQVHLDERYQCEVKSVPGYDVYQWPWTPQSRYSNSSCGVSLALNRRRFCQSDVCHVYEPTAYIAGRA
eukprot:12045093-Heterocapsa_arctica.AAC.1